MSTLKKRGKKIVDSAENTGNVSCVLAGSGDMWYIFIVSIFSDYRQLFQGVLAFAKISDDYGKKITVKISEIRGMHMREF